MNKKIIKFDSTEITKYKFHQNKSPISINDIDINKIVLSNKLPFGKQDFRFFIQSNNISLLLVVEICYYFVM